MCMGLKCCCSHHNFDNVTLALGHQLFAVLFVQAMAWVKALRQTWMHCFKHTLRGTDPDGAVHGMSRLMAQNELLRQSLLAHTSLGTHNSDSEYWRCAGLWPSVALTFCALCRVHCSCALLLQHV